VAMKIDSPGITHKSDVGGVRLDICNEAQLLAAYDVSCPDFRDYASNLIEFMRKHPSL